MISEGALAIMLETSHLQCALKVYRQMYLLNIVTRTKDYALETIYNVYLQKATAALHTALLVR